MSPTTCRAAADAPGVGSRASRRNRSYPLRWGRNDSALWCAGMGGVPCPVLQVSRPQHALYQLQEPLVMDLLGQDSEHDLVVEAAEAVGDVAFDEPGGARPGRSDLVERGMAASTGSEPV